MASSQVVRVPSATDEVVDRLLGRVAAGDPFAFDRLYSVYHARVIAVALGVLHDLDHAQEVAQEVFLQLWQQAERFDPARGSTSAWVKRIAYARAVDRAQARDAAIARDTRYAATTQHVDYDMVVEEVLHGAEAATLRQVVQRLPPLQRQAIILAYYKELGSIEISQQLQVNYSTVKTRIRNGLITLSTRIDAAGSALSRNGESFPLPTSPLASG